MTERIASYQHFRSHVFWDRSSPELPSHQPVTVAFRDTSCPTWKNPTGPTDSLNPVSQPVKWFQEDQATYLFSDCS